MCHNWHTETFRRFVTVRAGWKVFSVAVPVAFFTESRPLLHAAPQNVRTRGNYERGGPDVAETLEPPVFTI